MENKKIKPMLICNEEIDLNKIKYPLLISNKLDGIRCLFINGQMLSRSFKQISNKQLQEKFQNLKNYSKKNNVILDGEVCGKNMTFQEVTHYCMTEDLDDKKNIKKIGHSEVIPEALKFNCFDCIVSEDYDMPFLKRYEYISKMIIDNINFVVVEQTEVNNAKEVEDFFEKALLNGYEGAVLKNGKLGYKCGRTTFNENSSYKCKPFRTFDSIVLDIEERFLNLNESEINELGKSFKRNTKDNKEATGIAASFIVDYEGQKQKVVLTGTEEFRRDVWKNKQNYIGKTIEWKGMKYGSVDKIRHPVFVRWRGDLQ